MSAPVTLHPGWNLVGLGTAGTLDLTTTLNDPGKVLSVWRWIRSGNPATDNRWGFFTPNAGSITDFGQAYAQARGYEAITTIGAGQGFWVSALDTLTIDLPEGSVVTAAGTAASADWNLIAIGENLAPGQFNVAQGNVVTTLWAWDNATGRWLFHAPSLESQGGTVLKAHAESNGHLDFATEGRTLGQGVGFWVNMSSATAGPPPLPIGGAIQGNALSLAGTVTSLGTLNTFGYADGGTSSFLFNQPWGITSDGTSHYIADTSNNRIRRMNIATGDVTTLAGSGATGSADGTGTAAQFTFPDAITNDGTHLYVVEANSNRIRKVNIASGVVTTLNTGFLNQLRKTITADGTWLYIVLGRQIYRVNPATGATSLFAGAATAGSTDGPGNTAQFFAPAGLTTDGQFLYVADSANHNIRKVDLATAVVSTVAGLAGTLGSANGIGTAARFSSPGALTTDGTTLYVSDDGNRTVRRILLATNAVTSLAGKVSTTGGWKDGTGTGAEFKQVSGLTTDGQHVYASDTGNHRIRRIQ